jgi:hypothetical protein
MPSPLLPPYGTYARLLFREGTTNEIDLTLSAANGDFRGDVSQKGRLAFLSWDRLEVDGYTMVSQPSARGRSFQVGPDFRRPFKFLGQLLLLEQKYRMLEAMFEAQQDFPTEDIFLFDHRLMLTEAIPRTRARFDPVTTTGYVAPGVAMFWPIYRAEISSINALSFGRRTSGDYRYSVDVELAERIPPLGTAGDR